MQRCSLPVIVRPSAAVRRDLPGDIPEIVDLVLRALLRSRRTLEIAHQQIVFQGREIAFSSHIGSRGDVILDLDIGDPALKERIIFESDLSRARRINAQKADRRGDRPHQNGARRR